jgi:hypothetical protein
MDPPVKMIKKVMTISIILAVIGVCMAYTALVLDMTVLKEKTEEFYTEHDGKTETAEAQQIKADIENIKTLMLTLKLAGVATILLGITIALLGILRMLSLMPIGLGDVLRANLEDMGLGKEMGK